MDIPTIKFPRKKRLQSGQVIERSNRFYSRYYLPDGSMKAERIADKDAKHHSRTCKPVKLLHQVVMLRVNSARDIEDKGADLSLTEFWTGTFSPFSEGKHRKSTADSYEDLWRRHISPAIGSMKLSNIRTVHVQELLTSLAKKDYGRNTVNHCRSTVSAVLCHACNLGVIQSNPVSGAKILASVKAPSQTEFYTEEEVQKTIEALDGMPDARAAFALAFYCGLRTSEIQALRWADLNLENGIVTVSQAQVRRTIGKLKTPESHADVPLVSQVTSRELIPPEDIAEFAGF